MYFEEDVARERFNNNLC